MKKVLLIGEDESNSFLLCHLKEEGCEVALLTKYNSGVDSYKRLSSPAEALAWGPEYVICDSQGYSPFLKAFRDSGAEVLGGGPITDKLETDLVTALDFLEGAGVPTLDYRTFKDAATAIDYVLLDSNKPWRLTCGMGDSEGYRGGMELAEVLERRVSENTLPPQFIVHRDFPGLAGPNDNHIDMWSSFCVTGMVHEKGLMNPCFAVNIAHTDTGIPVFEGVTLFPIPLDSPLVSLTLGRAASALSRLNYVGPVTLSCMVQPPDFNTRTEEDDFRYWDDKICAQRIMFTPPPGFWAAFIAGLEMPFHLFLARLLTPQRNGNPFDFWEGVVSSRKLTLPPYPMTEAAWLSPDQKTSLLGMIPSTKLRSKKNVLWSGVKESEDGYVQPVVPVIGWLTGKATSANDSLRQIRSEYDFLNAPFTQVDCSISSSFEVDMLPTGLAGRQLEWEKRVAKDMETRLDRKLMKVVTTSV